MFVLFITVFAAVIPASIMLPMLPFIGQKYGASAFEVSLLFTLMPLIVILVSPVWGRMSDRFGRKPVYLGSLAASAAAFVVFGFADSLTSMFVARCLQGLTGGNVTIAFAMVADSTSHEHRAKYLGYTSGAMALAFAIGPVFGGLLMGENATTFDHALPAFLGAGFTALATLIGIAFLKETRSRRTRSGASTLSVPTDPATAATVAPDQPYEPPSRPLGRIGLAVLIVQFLIGGYVSGSDQFVFPFWARDLHGFGPNEVSYGMAVMGAGFMFATLGLIGPLTKSLGDVGAYAVGAFLDVIGLCILLLGPNVWISLFGLWLAVTGIGVWNTVLSSVLSKVSPPDRIGFMLGLSNGASMIGRVIGPLIAGGVFIEIGVKVPFIVSMVLVFTVLANATRLILRQRRAAGAAST